jgi:Protein of unknown function (DUF2934)
LNFRRRAHELYEERGCEVGHGVDDWLRAKAEIAVKNAKTAAAFAVRRQGLLNQPGPWAKRHFRAHFTHEFLVPAAQMAAQPLLDRALFLLGPRG